MVPRPGLEPGWLSPTDFLTTIAFATISVCSLDFTITIAFASGARRQVSTPSLSGLARYWHFKAFTEFDAFYFGRFQPSTQFILKSVVSTDSTIGALFASRVALS